MKLSSALPILLVLAAGCQSVPATSYDFAEGARFGEYRTFSWLAANPVGFHKTMDAHVSPLIEQHLKDAAVAAFADAGLQYVENPWDADVLMAFTVGSRERILVDGYFSYYGYAISGDTTDSGYWVESDRDLGRIMDGQVCVDLFDRNTGQPVWHGTAEEALDADELDYWRERIPAILAYIAQGYPPDTAR